MPHDPDDPKAAIEREIVRQAMEPYRATLAAEELARMEAFLTLYVETHPAMQRRVARTLLAQAIKGPASSDALESSRADGGASRSERSGGSGVVLRADGPSAVNATESGVTTREPENEGDAATKKAWGRA